MASDTRPNHRRRKIIMLGVVCALLAGGGWLGWDYLHYGRFQQTTDNAYVKADFTIIAPKVAGIVAEVFVVANQTVSAGSPLARIDSADHEAKMAEAEALIAVSEAEANSLRAQVGEQKALVEKATAELAVAREELDFAQAEVHRYEPLAASGTGSRQQMDQLRNQERQARATLAARQAAVSGAEQHIQSLEAGILQAEAQARSAQAQRRAAEINVAACLIRAGIDGIIGDLTARPGQYAEAGQRLLTLVPARQRYVEANFKETQVAHMQPGQPVRVMVDAFPDQPVQGRVASFAPGTGAEFSILPPQNATGNFTKIVQRVPVRITLTDTAGAARLVPGMSVTVSVDTRNATNPAPQVAASGAAP
ncbi:HlyD family efflux transporter periplasmic adaptor subunit [Niveispirillum sp. SYP-B3756]|uniref:HlyD family secretion protein n=1 Tax=Niveispirillum sp. SYP-B3756 TaxID=2662178 RepID=UPI001292921E|nr:HlyD family secretion protein [Niveispirillum sp. SYP-B3756]MQP65067.1 HlyD family efflux transporter periplasmic adaptor subunit [Niveispirillum sp. SYP-B3756]